MATLTADRAFSPSYNDKGHVVSEDANHGHALFMTQGTGSRQKLVKISHSIERSTTIINVVSDTHVYLSTTPLCKGVSFITNLNDLI